MDVSTASLRTTSTYMTAASYLSSNSEGAFRPSHRVKLLADNEHTARARKAGLLGGGFDELDWSGCGMHVQLTGQPEPPLLKQWDIAGTGRAVVDAVLCRRVLLARKTMLCHRRFTTEEAFEEVKQLHKLQHSHIVRLVGSYFRQRSLSILTYPVADCDLDKYMQQNRDLSERSSLCRTFGCLVSAIAIVHANNIKHMDIKPKNILVQGRIDYIHLLLTDFGAARPIQDPLSSETDGPTSRTYMYCSPEVALGEARGRSSDIFSLGCVFAEMVTYISGKTVRSFQEARTDDGTTFYCNLPLVRQWLDQLSIPDGDRDMICVGENWKATILRMLEQEKHLRPSATALKETFRPHQCCKQKALRFSKWATP